MRVLLAGIVSLGEGIAKRNQLAAAQDELVDGVLGGFGDNFWVNEQQGIHGCRDFRGRRLDTFHVEVSLQLLQEVPRWLLLTPVHHGHWVGRIRAAPDIEAAHHADGFPFIFQFKDVLDGPGNIILKVGCPRRVEHWDNLRAVEVADRHADVKCIIEQLNAIVDRQLLCIGVSARVYFLQLEVAA